MLVLAVAMLPAGSSWPPPIVSPGTRRAAPLDAAPAGPGHQLIA
jgi:hypothetical protein